MDLKLDAGGNWLVGAIHRPSPNCDERPPGTAIELVVIHGISLPPAQFGTGCVEQLFCNQLDLQRDHYFSGLEGLRVSAHLLIARNGAVTQFVPFRKRAWHAGVSCYQGRRAVNDFSIGIELEGTDFMAYEACQYAQLARVLLSLFAGFADLNAQRLVGHSDIAPGRKTDPGPAFQWTTLQHLLTAGGTALQFME